MCYLYSIEVTCILWTINVRYSVHENCSYIPSLSHMSSVHTLSHYLISILILSFYLYISILRVSSLEVIGESLVYIFFILKAFQCFNCNYIWQQFDVCCSSCGRDRGSSPCFLLVGGCAAALWLLYSLLC